MILHGKPVAEKVLGDVRAGVERFRAASGVTPTLAVVLIGDDPASQVYVRNKKRAADSVGIATQDFIHPAGLGQSELLDLVRRLNADRSIHGVLIQLPLPKGLNEDEVIATLAPAKDADGLHPENLGRLLAGAPATVPCTPAGCIELLRRFDVPIAGARVALVGRGITVGRPLGLMLTRRSENATVVLCHTGTRDLAAEVRQADIVVAAAGQPGLITADMVKPGAAVLDVGVSRIVAEDGTSKVAGDVADDVAEVAGWVSPNPGGVGPMTRAMLLSNIVAAAERQLAETSA